MKRLLVLFALLSLLPVMVFGAYFLPKMLQKNDPQEDSRPPVKRVEIEAPPRTGPIPEPAGPILRPKEIEGRVVTEALVTRTQPNVHVVVAGETLSAIVKRRYDSLDYLDDVLRANPGLNPNRISIGQRIVLPPKDDPAVANPSLSGRDPTDPLIHVVLRGQNLHDIAIKHYCDSAMYIKIFEYNRDQLSSPEALQIGRASCRERVLL